MQETNEEIFFIDTHKGNAHSNKTQGFTKSMNMGIWVIGTLNHYFIRILKLKLNFQIMKQSGAKLRSF